MSVRLSVCVHYKSLGMCPCVCRQCIYIAHVVHTNTHVHLFTCLGVRVSVCSRDSITLGMCAVHVIDRLTKTTDIMGNYHSAILLFPVLGGGWRHPAKVRQDVSSHLHFPS